MGCAWHYLLDLIYPRTCHACRRVLRGEPNPCFCNGCWRNLPLLDGPCCPSCGVPFRSGAALSHSPTHRCGACRVKPPRFDQAVAAGVYDGVLADAIRTFKYRGKTTLAGPLADVLLDGMSRFSEMDALVPVPLDLRRLREREYNQSLLLCDALARKTGCHVIADGLERIRATPPQTGLPLKERQRNVRGAFRARRPEAIQGRHILLVDDVLTTGATVNECARVLKRAKARSVGVLTVARVVPFLSSDDGPESGPFKTASMRDITEEKASARAPGH
jgi:ComF family protein